MRGLSFRALVSLLVAGVLAYGLASALIFPGLVLEVPDNPVTTTPVARGVAYQDLAIPGPAVPLEAWWIPASTARGTLIFVHGAGSSRTSTLFHSLDFYAAMQKRGFNLLTFDLRNHGNSASTNGKLGMGQTEWPDVVAAMTTVKGLPGAAPPYIVMGISMGGATLIHAADNGLDADGFILLDPVLDNRDALAQGIVTQIAIPPVFFAPTTWFATQFHGIARGAEQPLALAQSLSTPTLLIQDPEDPVTRAAYARQLYKTQPSIRFREAPTIPADHPCIAGTAGWGSHVAAFHCHQEWTLNQILAFIEDVSPPL